MRGMNVNHMLTQIYEGSGGTSFGRLTRIRLKSKIAITRMRVVYATFWQAGNTSTGLFDQEWAYPINIQAALEYPWTAARTAIPASRPKFKFGGANQFTYGGTGSTPLGYAMSDELVPAGGIPADTYFGIWTAVEPPTSQPLTIAITALSSAGTTATALCDPTGLYVNGTVNVTSASVAGYNNQFSQITAVVPGVSFSYTTASSNLAAATTATAVPQFLPANVVNSAAVDRSEGLNAAASSAASFIAADTVSSATTCGAMNASAAGSSAGYAPSFLLIDYANGAKTVLVLGDSTEFGVSAGAATNVIGRDGDVMGPPDHGISWMDQGIYYNNGLNYGNMGKGGDGAKWLRTPSTWALRRNLITLFNPTHIINGMGFNDQGLTAAAVWQATTNYYRGQVATKGGSAYIQLDGTLAVPITSGATGPVGTTPGVYETDGTGRWAYFGPSTNPGAQGFAWNMVLNDQIKALCPGRPVYNATIMPVAAYATLTVLGDQTVSAGAGGQRNNFNGGIKSRNDLLGYTAYFNPNTYVENDEPNGDGKWIVDGSTANLVSFGAHFNSNGNRLAKDAISAGSFA